MHTRVRKSVLLTLCAALFLSPFQSIAADLSPLTRAVLASDYQAVASSLRAGAPPNAIDPQTQHIPLYMAVAPGGPRDTDIVELLVRGGAKLDAIDPQSQLTPLMAAMVVTEKGPFAVLEGTKANQLVGQLLKLGADPNRVLAKGESPLMVATGLGNLPMVKTLLAHGANVKAKDQQGTTALHIAFETGQSSEMRNTLLAAGADPSAMDASGRKPGESKPASTPVAEPTAPPPNTPSASTAQGNTPQVEKPSSINKWLIGGAVVAAAVLGAVALSKYTDEQKRRKASEAAAAALASAQNPQPVSPPPAPPVTPQPLPQPPVSPPAVVREIVIERLAPLTAQPTAGTEFVLHATLFNKTDVDLIYNGTLTGPTGQKFFGPRVVVIRKGARETMDVPVTLQTAGLQDLALQLDPVNEPSAKPQMQKVSVNVAPKAVTPPPPAPVVSIAVFPASMNEDASGVMTFTVSLNTPTSVNTVATYSLGGTATNGTDYTTTGTVAVTILAGQTSATFAVDPTPDNVVESNETVIATLTNVTGGATISGSNGAATATITDDDAAPVVREIMLEKLVPLPAQPIAGAEFVLRATLLNKTDVDITNNWTLTGPNGLKIGPQPVVTKTGTTGVLDIKLTLQNPGTQVLALQMDPISQVGGKTQKQEISINVGLRSDSETSTQANQECPKPVVPQYVQPSAFSPKDVEGIYEQREISWNGSSVLNRIVVQWQRAEILQEVRGIGGSLESSLKGVVAVENFQDSSIIPAIFLYSSKSPPDNKCSLDGVLATCNQGTVSYPQKTFRTVVITDAHFIKAEDRNATRFCWKASADFEGCATPKYRAASFDGEYSGSSFAGDGSSYFHQAIVHKGQLNGVTCTVSKDGNPTGAIAEWYGSLDNFGKLAGRGQFLQPTKRYASGVTATGFLPEGSRSGKLDIYVSDVLGKSFKAELVKSTK